MAHQNQNPLMMPNANTNLNGLGALSYTSLGKPGESPLGAMAGGINGNSLSSACAGNLATEGLGNASAANAMSNTANSLANQLMSNLGSMSTGMQGATSALKDWTNGLSMPPLAAGASGVSNGLPGSQLASIAQDVAGLSPMTTIANAALGSVLPPLAANANTVVDAAQSMMPTLSGQAVAASAELGKLASAVGDSKDFNSLIGNPIAALQKGAQAINLDPSTYDNIPVPGAANASTGVNAASQLMANTLDCSSISAASNSGITSMNGANGAEAQFANALLTRMNNAVSGANMNFDASVFTGGALNAALNLNPNAGINSAISAAQSTLVNSAQAQVAAHATQQVNAQAIAQLVDTPFVQAASTQPVIQAVSAAPLAHTAPTTAPVYTQPSASAHAPIVSAPAHVTVSQAPQSVPAGGGVTAAFQAAESTRKMEAEANQATQSTPKNSGADFLKAVTEERARQAALNGNQSNNGYPSWAKPI